MNSIMSFVFPNAALIGMSVLVFYLAAWIRKNTDIEESMNIRDLIAQTSPKERARDVAVTLVTIAVFALVLFLIFSSFGAKITFALVAVVSIWNWLNLSMAKRSSWVMRGLVAIVVGTGWAIFPSWITYSAFGITAVTFGLSAFAPKKLWVVLVIMIVVVAWDTYGVLLTDTIPNMVSAQAKFIPPLLVLIPTDPLNLWGGQGINLLGLADIAVSGLAVIYSFTYKIEGWLMAAYSLGLLVTMAAAAVFRAPIPATLVFAPLLALTLVVVGAKKKIKFS